jgi:hypothetical protein
MGDSSAAGKQEVSRCRSTKQAIPSDSEPEDSFELQVVQIGSLMECTDYVKVLRYVTSKSGERSLVSP